MPAWHVCNSLLIPDDDVAELFRLARISPNELEKTDRWLPIAEAMRAECPHPGDTWHKLLSVCLPVDGPLPDHSHREHTMLLYPEACDPVLIEGSLFRPDAGTMVYISPRTHHSVPAVTADRLTIAMLVTDA